MSQYVKRCTGNYCGRRVQGLTSFRLSGKGQRADECRFCEAQAKADGLAPSRSQHLADLLRDEQKLEGQLTRIRSKIRAMQQRRTA